MSKIEINLTVPNNDESYEGYLLDSLTEICRWAGCEVKSIALSGDRTISREVINPNDVIDVEWTEHEDCKE